MTNGQSSVLPCDAPGGAQLDALVSGLKDALPDASLVAVYPHRTPLPAARLGAGISPGESLRPSIVGRYQPLSVHRDVTTQVLVGDTLIQPHPPVSEDDAWEDYLTSVQSTVLGAVEDLGAACAEHCILDLRWLPQRHDTQALAGEAVTQAMQYGVDVIAVGNTETQSYFKDIGASRWVDDLFGMADLTLLNR